MIVSFFNNRILLDFFINLYNRKSLKPEFNHKPESSNIQTVFCAAERLQRVWRNWCFCEFIETPQFWLKTFKIRR